MAKAKMNGSGWHSQSIRHSNAKRFGKAGGQYANSITMTHYDAPQKIPQYKQIPVYTFEQASPELKKKILENYYDINVEHDWWEMDGLFDPTKSDLKKLGKDFTKQYNKDTKKGYSTLNNFKIEAFDIERGNYLQIKNIDTKNQNTFLQQIGLTKKEAQKVYNAKVDNYREDDSQIILNFNEELPEADQDKIQEKASRGFAELISRAKKSLRESYDYYTSEESIAETLKANEYTFNERGKIE